MYPTKKAATDALNGQPFTLSCRARHIVVPVYERDILGNRTQRKAPIGWGYRLRSVSETRGAK